MKPIRSILSTLAALVGLGAAGHDQPTMRLTHAVRLTPPNTPVARPRASGIPTPPRLNQRQKRKANRRAFPHGFRRVA